MTTWFITLPWLHYLHFTNIEPRQDMRFEKESRYYLLRLEKDLLEDWTITASNGRIKSKLGQSRILPFLSYANAYDHFSCMVKIRHQRGYRLKALWCENNLFLHTLLLLLIANNYTNNKANVKKEEKPRHRLIQNNCPSICQNHSFQITTYQLGFIF